MNTRLVFVYNADATLFAKVSDFAHKILSPKNYTCKLCTITYDNLGVKKEWGNFVNELEVEVEFLHKDEFERKYRYGNVVFPAVFSKNEGGIDLLIRESEINDCSSISDLKNLVLAKLEDKHEHAEVINTEETAGHK